MQTIPLQAVQIQLPSCDRNFELSISCRTRYFVLPYPATQDPSVQPDEGIIAQYITILAIRQRILR